MSATMPDRSTLIEAKIGLAALRQKLTERATAVHESNLPYALAVMTQVEVLNNAISVIQAIEMEES